jgi:ParB/RepB/Spo0J family partition protein
MALAVLGSKREESELLAQLKHGAALRSVRLADVLVGGEQPRKTFDEVKLRDLADSIRQHGIIQPPLLRLLDDGRLQVVAGHRRVRAAMLAGMEETQALVRQMTDEQVFDARMAENLHRDDLTPLEEGLEYYRMTLPVEEGGLGRRVEEVAEKMRRSEAHVYSLRALFYLCPEGRRALELKQIESTVAQQVARIPDPAQQAKCVAWLVSMRPKTEREEDRRPLPSREAARHIRDNYMLDLGRAPFDRKDDVLVMAAGPCTTCPHNSDRQPGDLFESRSRPYCLKPACYKEKVAALWAREQERAKEKGHKAMSIREGKEIFPNGQLAMNAPFVDLDGPCHEDKRKRTWRELLGESIPPVTAVPDMDVRPHELVDRAEALAALKKEGHRFTAQRAEANNRPSIKDAPEEQGQREAEEKVRGAAREAFVEEAVSGTEKSGLGAEGWRVIVESQLHVGNWRTLAERRGIEGGLDELMKRVGKMPIRELAGWGLELALIDIMAGVDSEDLRPLGKKLDVDVKALEARVRAQLEAEKGTEAKPAEKKGKARGKSAKRKK